MNKFFKQCSLSDYTNARKEVLDYLEKESIVLVKSASTMYYHVLDTMDESTFFFSPEEIWQLFQLSNKFHPSKYSQVLFIYPKLVQLRFEPNYDRLIFPELFKSTEDIESVPKRRIMRGSTPMENSSSIKDLKINYRSHISLCILLEKANKQFHEKIYCTKTSDDWLWVCIDVNKKTDEDGLFYYYRCDGFKGFFKFLEWFMVNS